MKWGVRGGGHSGKRKPSNSEEKKSFGRAPGDFSDRDVRDSMHKKSMQYANMGDGLCK